MKSIIKISASILLLLLVNYAIPADAATYYFGGAKKSLSAATATVEAGYYDTTNLTAVATQLAAGNIKKDTVIFGITGTYEGGTSYVIPKTNQTALYVTDYPTAGSTEGCDGWYQKGTARSFTVSAPGLATEEVVTDNITGLMWVKDGNGRGCNVGNQLTWNAAIAFCENLTFAGYSDWRLPNKNELISIINDGTYTPAIYTAYFSNTKSERYWSSTWTAQNTGYAWFVYFGNGFVSSYSLDNTIYVRPVRGGQ